MKKSDPAHFRIAFRPVASVKIDAKERMPENSGNGGKSQEWTQRTWTALYRQFRLSTTNSKG
jgi:hypothetical protein